MALKTINRHRPIEVVKLKGKCKAYTGAATGLSIGGVEFIVLAADVKALEAAHAAIHKGRPGRTPTFNPALAYEVAIIHKDNIVEDDEL